MQFGPFPRVCLKTTDNCSRGHVSKNFYYFCVLSVFSTFGAGLHDIVWREPANSSMSCCFSPTKAIALNKTIFLISVELTSYPNAVPGTSTSQKHNFIRILKKTTSFDHVCQKTRRHNYMTSPTVSFLTPDAHKVGRTKLRSLTSSRKSPKRCYSDLTDDATLAKPAERDECLKVTKKAKECLLIDKKGSGNSHEMINVLENKQKEVVLTWRDDELVFNFISFNREKFNNILQAYREKKDSSCSNKECEHRIHSYLREKFYAYSLGIMTYPFRVPDSLFQLLQVTLSISHQMFTNPVLFSGATKSYSSEDRSDVCFGSCGTWTDFEGTVSGAAGQYFAESTSIIRFIKTMEKSVRKDTPYCRVIALPVTNDTELCSLIESEDLVGEKLAIIPRGSFLMLPRNIDIFREGLKESFLDEDEELYPDYIVIMIWINEHYRMLNPVPADIDDCFLAWAASALGSTEEICISSFPRVFPLRLRSCLLKEDEFHF